MVSESVSIAGLHGILVPSCLSAIIASNMSMSMVVSFLDVSRFLTPLSHPFWIFEWAALSEPGVPLCSFILFLSGILCSASGIGGGGMYVAVLMVFGQIPTHDAVPLSKAIVFFGSLSTFALNLHRQSANRGSQVINVHACRLVVPMALSGTFLGVLLNQHTPETILVLVLFILLCFMTAMVLKKAWEQHCQEEQYCQSLLQPLVGDAEKAEVEDETAPLLGDNTEDNSDTKPAAMSMLEGRAKGIPQGSKERGDALTNLDVGISLGLISVVVLGGILRFHLQSCQDEKSGTGYPGSCRHPLLHILFLGRLERWMNDPVLSYTLQKVVSHLPMWCCVILAVLYGRNAHAVEGWKVQDVVAYQSMALVTGLLAGLVGVGGGLVFSPFMLLMGMDPAVAIATSSTCVMFTSSSTTLQYLFVDRIMVSLAVFYGCITLTSSYIGTSLVYLLQDHCKHKRSYITWVVAVSVSVSTALSLGKFLRLVAAS